MSRAHIYGSAHVSWDTRFFVAFIRVDDGPRNSGKPRLFSPPGSSDGENPIFIPPQKPRNPKPENYPRHFNPQFGVFHSYVFHAVLIVTVTFSLCSGQDRPRALLSTSRHRQHLVAIQRSRTHRVSISYCLDNIIRAAICNYAASIIIKFGGLYLNAANSWLYLNLKNQINSARMIHFLRERWDVAQILSFRLVFHTKNSNFLSYVNIPWRVISK